MINQTLGIFGFALASGVLGIALPSGLIPKLESRLVAYKTIYPSNYPTSFLSGFSEENQPVPSRSEGVPVSNQFGQSANSVDYSADYLNVTRLEVKLRQRQVSLYRGETRVKTYNIGIGGAGWETPTGVFSVSKMIQNPRWIHPFTDDIIASGDPENPLGRYWIGFWSDGRNSIGFHETPDIRTVGAAASHGCLRMHGHDIEELYSLVYPGMPVIVKQ